jgi:hypothetical protein
MYTLYSLVPALMFIIHIYFWLHVYKMIIVAEKEETRSILRCWLSNNILGKI